MKVKLFILLFITTFFSGCKSDDNNTLPPATQTGAGTFACYVNGKAFVDKEGPPHAYYQLVDGGYYFATGGNSKKLNPRGIYIQTKKKEIFEGETYFLIEEQEGNAFGGGSFSIAENYYSWTDLEYTGELTITKLDFEKQIVSGIFWFDLQHPKTGERVEIREGRFDTLFTQ